MGRGSCREGAAARLVGPQLRVQLGIEQSPALLRLWIDQVTPAGSGSLTVTPVAVPAPLLVTVPTKPIASAWFSGLASAVLVMWMLAWLQTICAEASPLPSLVVVTVAVLL